MNEKELLIYFEELFTKLYDNSYTASDLIEKSEKKSLVILKNILAMHNELDVFVLAEGVESLDQVELLSSYGCDIIQGYYYDKPLSKEDITKRLINKNY